MFEKYAEYLDTLDDYELVGLQCHHFKATLCYKKEEETQQVKMIVCFTRDDRWGGLQKAVPAAFAAFEGVRKLGPPPRSDLERVAQRMLRKVQGATK